MKTYYDLDDEKKQKYMKEFRATPGGKNLYEAQIWINFFLVAVGIITLFGVIFVNELASQFVWAVLLIAFFIELYNIYLNINFAAWLKNKHNIKRW